MKEPIVTILLPCYNVEVYLSQCLDSIVNQRYKNLQIVLIDDGSKDKTWNIMQEYAYKDSRIEIYQQENQGVSITRNNLLDKVKGDYILFVDSDDWIELDMVKFLLTNVKEKDADIITCGCIPAFDRGMNNVVTIETWDKDKVIKEFLRHVIFSGSLWNKLIKSSIVNEIRFDTRVSYGEDALFCWYVLQKVDNIVVTNAPLYNHRINEYSLSTSPWTPQIKGTSSIVWRTISEDSTSKWPMYAKIAKARYAIEDMWGLYYASLTKYRYDEYIKERQQNVRKNLKLIRKSGLVSKNKIVVAYVLAYCYALGKLLKLRYNN